MTSAAKPFNKRDQRDEKDERDDSEVVDNARQCGAHDSDNADTRPRSRPYRLSCPSRPKITRDEKEVMITYKKSRQLVKLSVTHISPKAEGTGFERRKP